jgi:transketolase
MGADWDDRWRTGGSVDEVMDEAHLTTRHILEGIGRFVRDRESRLQRLHAIVASADRSRAHS